MKKAALYAASILGLLVAHTAQAASEAKDLCPADATFKSRVDQNLNKLNTPALKALADKGNTDAMVLLGVHYTAGEKPDYAKAMSFFQAAADKKNADGEYYMALIYLNGAGVPKDDAKALTWFRRSAAQGHDVSRYWAGELIAKGRGVAASWEEALPYFTKAAQGAVPNAMVELGIMYAQGLGGLPMDYEKAAACYRVARKLGSALADYNLSLLVGNGHVSREAGDPDKAIDPASLFSIEPRP